MRRARRPRSPAPCARSASPRRPCGPRNGGRSTTTGSSYSTTCSIRPRWPGSAPRSPAGSHWPGVIRPGRPAARSRRRPVRRARTRCGLDRAPAARSCRAPARRPGTDPPAALPRSATGVRRPAAAPGLRRAGARRTRAGGHLHRGADRLHQPQRRHPGGARLAPDLGLRRAVRNGPTAPGRAADHAARRLGAGLQRPPVALRHPKPRRRRTRRASAVLRRTRAEHKHCPDVSSATLDRLGPAAWLLL